MNRKGKNKNMNYINKNTKAITQKNIKEEKKIKTPLYKIFMEDNNSKDKKKFHLLKNPTSYANQEINMKQKNKYNLLFSYKILEKKYNSTPDIYDNNNLDILILKKKCHYLAEFNEMGYCTSTLTEYLKREYSLKEVRTRIPQYASYYKNYLLFFCKPFFNHYTINKKMVKHMEKVAQIFYNENYADEENEEKKEESQERKKMPKMFNEEVIKDIENCDSFTYVNSETAMEQIQLIINKKLRKKENNINENKLKEKEGKKEKEENIIFPIEIEQSTIIEDNHRITPVYKKEEFHQKLNNKKKIVFDMENSNESEKDDIKISQSNNSINILIKEMNKDKKGNLILNDIKDLNENPYTYRNINGFVSPINKLNMNVIKTKSLKNMNNNCILIQNGKTTNNINININNLTIGQKIMSPNGSFNKIIKNLRELNNINNNINNNILKKTITKFKYKENNNNSLIKKGKNIKNEKNNTESVPHSNKIQIKNRINKNGLLTLPPQANNLLPNFKQIKKVNPSTLSNKVKKTRNKSNFRVGYNNGSTTNIYKNKKLNYYNISKGENKLGRFTIHGNEKINFKNMLNYNISNKELLSSERTKNNDVIKPKKIFTSILQMKKENVYFFNFKNSENGNVLSPINGIKKGLIINREKIKELKLRKKQLNLHKILNLIPNDKRSKSTGK